MEENKEEVKTENVEEESTEVKPEEVKEETNVEQTTNQEQPKKKNTAIIIVIIVAIISVIFVVGLVALLTVLFLLTPSKKTTTGDTTVTSEETTTTTTEETTTQASYNGKKLCNKTSGNSAYYGEYTDGCKDYITCESKTTCEYVLGNEDRAIINDGGTLSLYDNKSKLLKKNLGNVKYSDENFGIELYYSKSKNLVFLFEDNKDKGTIINITKDTVNNSVGKINVDVVEGDSLLTDTDYVPLEKGLYDVTTNKINTKFNSNAYDYVKVDNKEYIVGYSSSVDRIYTMDGDVKLEKNAIWGSEANNAFYYYENKALHKLNGSFNEVKSANDIDGVLMVDKGYTVIVKGTKLILTDQDFNEYTTFMNDYNDKDYSVHPMISGWWDKDNNGKEGIFIVVEIINQEKIKQFLKEHPDVGDDWDSIGYEYYYYPSTKESGVIPSGIGEYAKPVLYLYPTEETNIKVTFDKPNNLTTTYPKYVNSWNVLAKPNGDLYDKDGKYYYALYWEEKKNHEISFNEGFYVEGKEAINFLEDKLTTIGLNAKERNEFIMYWLPILEKNGKNLIYFELTEERDKNSPINIEPKPDSILRLAMHVKKVDKKTNIKEQKLTSFNRTGFAAVE